MNSDSVVLAGLADVRGWQEDFYRNLHQHPELSHREHATAAAVAQRLRGFGYDVHEGIGGTGARYPNPCSGQWHAKRKPNANAEPR